VSKRIPSLYASTRAANYSSCSGSNRVPRRRHSGWTRAEPVDPTVPPRRRDPSGPILSLSAPRDRVPRGEEYDVKRHWHERFHADAGNAWLRRTLGEVMGVASA
jgi:hypothetical protein